MTSFQIYVLGFMFSHDHEHVALIRKKKPEWQAGLLNGIGGKVESGESPSEAMVREFREETGVSTSQEQWRKFARMTGEHFMVFVYSATGDLADLRTATDEVIEFHRTKFNPREMVSNLSFLIPMGMDQSKGFIQADIHYV